MLGAGFGMCFIAGIFFDKFGPAVTSLTGSLIAATSYALLWTASVHKSYYLDKSWLTAVFFFTSGLGSVFFYMVGLSTNVLNFGQEHRSKVVGLLDVMYSGCPVVVSILYYKVIQNSSPSDSFGTCALLLSISFGVIGALCMLCLRIYTPLSLSHGREILSGYDELENFNDTDRSERDILENDESSNKHLPLKDLLQDVRYWLLLGIFTFECTAIMVYINNVTVISKSNGFSKKDEYLVLILFINEAVFGLIVGSFSDLRKDTITKPILLLLAGICAAICRRCCPCLKMDTGVIYHVLRWTGLLVGCMAHLMAGAILIFSVYQNDLKETFNYTQSEVERQSSMLGAGFGMGFIAGIFFDKFGPAVTSLTGLGSVFFYMVDLSTNILNFAQEHRSKVIGFLDAVFAGCPIVVSILYYRVIQNRSPSDSFGTCVLLLSISFGVIGALCMLCLRIYTPLSNSREILPGYDELVDFNDTDRESSENDESSNQHLPLKDLLQDTRYWLLLGIFTFECTATMVYINNVTVISKSNGFSKKDEYLVLILFINEAVFGLIVGAFSDLRKDTITKPVLLLSAGICAAICVSLTMIWGQYYFVFCISTFLCGFAAGIFWTICPAAISEIFYVGDVGRNLGIAMSMGSLLRWIVQEAFGIFYDDVTPTGDIYCTAGKSCVRFRDF
ncbi:hypothetical protein FSP39_013148 [Pinctada imbricata]|uniref:Uncharacterized protein n=1 Tax=Pinctada imbricata TaxID=66713 RepID=A0AA88XYK4_PINIB|nr:hypothetical protein FSP39_013148 [Pinctada imbricata]